MNKKQRKIHNLRRKVRRNFTTRIATSELLPGWESRVEAASMWYVDEYAYCKGVAEATEEPVEVVAAYYAATSPRQRLSQNKVLTLHAAMSRGVVDALPNVVETCARIYDYSLQVGKDPVDAVRGRKTHNFARALLGDTEAVVVDVWMMRAAGFPERDAPTKLQYDAIEHVTRSMARDMGLEPRTLQALLWIIVRGGAA